MGQFMAELLKMSLAASFSTVLVMGIRLLLKPFPKIYSYVLWGAVFIRLLCPFTIESSISILPENLAFLYPDIQKAYQETEAGVGTEEDGFTAFDNGTDSIGKKTVDTKSDDAIGARIIETGLPGFHRIGTDIPIPEAVQSEPNRAHPGTNEPPLSVWWMVWIFIWELGVLAVFFYYFTSWIKLSWKLGSAVEEEPGIYVSDKIKGSFVAGIVRPRIYLAAGLLGEERRYILMHEKIHIKRRDYLVKAVMYAALMLHWFNPLVWLSVCLMEKDMEMSCDEGALKVIGEGARKGYSTALLHVAEKNSGFAFPLAFGESNTKKRVRNVLNYRKPTKLAALAAVLITGIAAASLITNPKVSAPVAEPDTVYNPGQLLISKEQDENSSITIIGGQDGPTSLFVAGKQKENLDYLFSRDGVDYFLKIPDSGKTDGMRELIQSREGTDRVLDSNVYVGTSNEEGEQNQILLCGSRIIYTAMDNQGETNKQEPVLCSIALDGSGKKTAKFTDGGYALLCYDQGYLYYEETSPDQEFPKAIYQMTLELEGRQKQAEIDGSLITVNQGDIYYLGRDAKKSAIYIRNRKDGSDRVYDKCGLDAMTYRCTYAKAEDGVLSMQFTDRSDSSNKKQYQIMMKGYAETEYLNSIFKAFGGETEIPYISALNLWNGIAYDRSDSFMDLAAMDQKIPYFEPGTAITFHFTKDRMPDTIKLYDYVLNEKGEEQYNQISPQEVEFSFQQGMASFSLDHNYAEALNSQIGTYGEGETIRGFKLICTWGDNECEYAMMVRTDGFGAMKE